MKKYVTIKNAAVAVGVCLLLYTLIGFFVLPYAGKALMQKSFKTYPDCTANVDAIRFNPFTLEAGLDNFEINETAGSPVFKLKRLYLNLSGASILKLAPVISRLELDSPEFFLVLEKNKGLNLTRIFTGKEENKPEESMEEKESTPFRFSLSNASILKGRFHFTDELKNKTQVIDDINLSLPVLSSLKQDLKDHTRPVLRFGLNNSPVDISLVSLPFDQRLDTQIDITAKGLDIGAFESYMGLPEGLTPASLGHLDLTVSGNYHMDTAAKNIDGHVLSLNLMATLTGVDIRMKKKTPLLACPEFKLNASSKNIFTRHIAVETLEFNGAQIDLERDENGELSLLGLFQDKESSATVPDSESNHSQLKKSALEPPDVKSQNQEKSPGFPFHISMADGGLKQCTLVFTDNSIAPAFNTTLSHLDIGLKKVSITPDGISGDWKAGFKTESLEHLETRGHFSTAPVLSLAGRLDLKEVVPEKYRPYYSPYGGKGLSIGTTGLGAGFDLTMEEDTPVFSISDGSLSLKDIRIQDQADDRPVVDIKGIDCSGILVDSAGTRIRVGTVLADTGSMDLARNKAGEINLVKRIEQMIPSQADPKTSDVVAEEKINQDSQPQSQWLFSIGRFDLKNYNLAFSDLGLLEPVDVTVSDIAVSAEDITTAKDGKGKIKAAMLISDTGKIDMDGDIKISPFEAVLNLDLSKIPVAPFQPYYTEYLNILITQGHAEAKGKLSVLPPETGGQQIQFQGQSALNEFISKTKFDNQDFFKCKSLYISGIDFGLAPLAVDIEKIALTDFYQKTLISRLGTLNLSQIVKTSPGTEKKSEQSIDKTDEQQPAKINIDAVTLQGGSINFIDHNNTPAFTANMTEIGGSITGISSLPEGKPAKVVLKGTHSGQAPLNISGQIDPLKKEPFVDLAVSFKNIGMPEFNPYTKKYLGYGIEKGKLILDLKYKIQDNQLKSSNHIFFDQLTLGDSVNSPDATSLPIPLAISLLKNANDEIKLDVPIYGDLNDPEFSYGSVVVTAITNLIVGVVTAPFKFLGSIVGISDGQDLGYAAFVPGSDVLDEDNKGKIDTLAGILAEKHGLNLEIDGQYNPETDREGIRTKKYQALLQSIQAGETQTVGMPVDSTIDQLAPETRQLLVETAYARAQFPKPMDESGNEKELTLAEKEKLLVTAIDVTEEELRDLGQRRSNSIRDYMISQGGIDPSRIFVKAPVPVKEEKTKEHEVKTLFVIK